MRTSVYLPNGQIQPMHGPSVSKLEFQRAQWCAWLRTALRRHLVLHPSSGQVRPERALEESLCSLFSWLQNVIQILTFLMCASLDFFSSFKKTHLLLYLISLLSKAHAKHNVSYEMTVKTNLERFFFCELAWSCTVLLRAIIKFRFRLKSHRN